jgi:hypothetical protein
VSEIAWQISHSVDSKANLPFAWAYITDVANWDDPPATFELEGPFEAGSYGTTRMPGQDPRHWQIVRVDAFKSYVLQMELDRATISFEWQFDGIAEGGTRLTQHIVLQGENAEAYVAQVQQAFGSSLAAGMTRIASATERAEAAGRGS